MTDEKTHPLPMGTVVPIWHHQFGPAQGGKMYFSLPLLIATLVAFAAPAQLPTNLDDRLVGCILPAGPGAFPDAARSRRNANIVGEIFIAGNDRTLNSVILKHVKVHPGQPLDYQALQSAENRLAACGLFKVDRRSGTRPTVSVIARDAAFPGRFVDILITIQERDD